MQALVIEPVEPSDKTPRVSGARRGVIRNVRFSERPGECRVRVTYAGICGTDLELLRGYAAYEGIPGHEFVGVVEDAPIGEQHWIGKRVVGEINAGCNSCEWCHAGICEHCPDRSVLGIVNRDGAFATHLSIPPQNLHEVPASLADEVAVFVEPTAAACEILTQVEVTPSARVAIVGDGRLGLLIGQVLRSTGADVTLVGRHEDKLSFGNKLGLVTCSSNDVLPRRSFDFTIDATGQPSGLRRALELVRPRGIVVMKSTFHGETPVSLWPAVVDEITLVGSRCGPFDKGIAMLKQGTVQTAPLVSGIFQLDDFGSAFDLAGRALKVLLKP